MSARLSDSGNTFVSSAQVHTARHAITTAATTQPEPRGVTRASAMAAPNATR